MNAYGLVWLLVSVIACSAGCNSREHSSSSGRSSDSAAGQVTITQFYAASTLLPRDESTSLCYGVEHAAAVRLDPPVEQVWPAVSRCLSVSPKETTTYTLTADDGHGQTTSRTVTITLTGPKPHLYDLSISAQAVAPGRPVTFCFRSKNATSVRGGPGRFMRGGAAANDCLADNPKETTTYKITVEGAGGQTDEASFTVKVR